MEVLRRSMRHLLMQETQMLRLMESRRLTMTGNPDQTMGNPTMGNPDQTMESRHLMMTGSREQMTGNQDRMMGSQERMIYSLELMMGSRGMTEHLKRTLPQRKIQTPMLLHRRKAMLKAIFRKATSRFNRASTKASLSLITKTHRRLRMTSNRRLRTTSHRRTISHLLRKTTSHLHQRTISHRRKTINLHRRNNPRLMMSRSRVLMLEMLMEDKTMETTRLSNVYHVGKVM
jgi:hypothetical protein